MISHFGPFKPSFKTIEAGVDEAGRGALAGPVFAASVVLREGFHHTLLRDSKKVKPKDRLELRKYIFENALAYSVASIDNHKIDQINIQESSFLAMHESISKLTTIPEIIVVDGNRFLPYPKIEHICIVGGDDLMPHIAAASILAKTYRDEFMEALHQRHPQYGWDSNKGYPTQQHKTAIRKYGLTEYHRITFKV